MRDPHPPKSLGILAQEWKERSVRDTREAIALGLQLDHLKDQLGASQVYRFAENRLSLKRRAVDKLVGLAQTYGKEPETVSYLPVDTLYRLTDHATPDDVRGEFLTRRRRGESPSADEIEQWIGAGRERYRDPVVAARQALRKKRDQALKPRRERERLKRAVQVHETTRLLHSLLKGAGLGQKQVEDLVYFFRHADRKAIRQVGDWLYVDRELPRR